ncbi:MAG TPA: sigma-70 family RNA polymerase sigma factor [Candidatus Angelobacter sp.]|nr:sigma-70 family RNA polymerase sigma factor [Candidatus Angelobacter sp.]
MATATILETEAELISRILAGEPDLYHDLIAPYERMVYVSVLSILRNDEAAEDCAQEAFLEAYRHLDQFKGESKFGSWLVRVALNEAKMELRRMRPELYESLDKSMEHEDGDYVPQTLGDWREIPSEALERKEVAQLIQGAIDRLSPIYHQVVILRDVQGMSVADTAQALEVTEAVVKTRLVRARLQLRDLLAPVLKDSAVVSRQAFKKGKNPWR